ncbi:3-oxo-Delta(4,5)-steroid 5-beta-reductase [Iris pallida]|uniref:3-oxo-Delta(4,5)-steroid 5-beta-reductase n=1 Tax=Iris pallida TaxID=29817 RepID=A0AAX6GGL4_IRIPA|nr:3-oxo-Delta(4,5)-steroid 5-beta-reductase [Iris pallida]
MLSRCSNSSPNTASTNHQCPTSPSSVRTSSFSLTISSQTGPFPAIASSRRNLPPSPSYPAHSTPNCSASALHSCFHLNTSPFEQLNASFLAYGSTAAHICCSAIMSASDASLNPSQQALLPGNLSVDPSFAQIAAYAHRLCTRFILDATEDPKIVVGRWTDHDTRPPALPTSSKSASSWS